MSSHIQVLARKRVREYQSSIKVGSHWSDSPSLCGHTLFSFPFRRSVFCQVSSHIQVLAKRKSREIQTKLKVHMLSDGTTLGSRITLPESRCIIWITKDVFARAFGIFSLPCCHNTLKWRSMYAIIYIFLTSWIPGLIWSLKLIFNYSILFYSIFCGARVNI